MNDTRYSLRIRWSVPDKLYIADVPELPGCKTHGKTYEEAVKNIQEVIELFLDDMQAAGEPIPQPQVLTQ